MNFLAHIFLSGEGDDLLKLGNFMGDTVRGKQYLNYPKEVQRGILLHRQIDTFTDAHPLFRQSKKRLVPFYGHYAGVITDIFYDYFLTKHWKNFSTEDLDGYIERFYTLMQEKKEVLNPQMQSIASYMMRDNWLKAYQSYSGLAQILYQMDKRTDFRSQMQYAITSLQAEESLFEEEFLPFFTQLQEFVDKKSDYQFLETQNSKPEIQN